MNAQAHANAKSEARLRGLKGRAPKPYQPMRPDVFALVRQGYSVRRALVILEAQTKAQLKTKREGK